MIKNQKLFNQAKARRKRVKIKTKRVAARRGQHGARRYRRRSMRSTRGWLYHRSAVDHSVTGYSCCHPSVYDLMWIRANLDSTCLSLELVLGHENMPAYRRGEWDGRAYFVKNLTKEQSDQFVENILNAE